MLKLRRIEEPKESSRRIFTLGYANFLVAVIALCVAGYTAWKQLRDVSDVTQVVYDISRGKNYTDPLKGSFSLAVYNSGTLPVVLNRAYLYFVEHKLARGKNRFGQDIIEEHPVALCNRDVVFMATVRLKDGEETSSPDFKATIIPKQEIKVITLHFDIENIYEFIQGFYGTYNTGEAPEELEGAICLASSYSNLSVENIYVHERLFVGKFYPVRRYKNSDPLVKYQKPDFMAGVPVQNYNHKQKVY